MFTLFAYSAHHTHFHHHHHPKIESVANIASSGTGYFLTAVRVRASPSTSSETVATYQAGDSVVYDSVVQNEGRTWISYIGGSGNRRYCCAVDSDGSVYIKNEDSSDVFGGVTGMKYIPTQGQFAQPGIAKSGCCFLAACVKGGCTTQAQCVSCWNWATSTGRVRSSDAWVSCGCENLARDCASHFGLPYHSDYSIVWNCKQSHFYVFRNGRELFNSAGLGWGVC